MTPIHSVAVIGAGTMGHGIAQVAAQTGHVVRLWDAVAGQAAAGRDRAAVNLDGAVARTPERVLGMHFFNPAHLMRLVEIVAHAATSNASRDIASYLDRSLREPQFAPPEVLKRMVAEGRLGRKAGRGFYDWTQDGGREESGK